MGIIRNNFSHTGSNAGERVLTEGSGSIMMRQGVKRDSNASNRCVKVGQSSKKQKGPKEKSQIMEVTNVRWWTDASQHLVQHSSKLRILKPDRSEREWLPTPISPTLCPGVPFVGRALYRRTKIFVATPSGRCTGGGFINEVLVESVCAAGRPPNVIYGTTGPRDCCTIVLLRHVQFIANNKIYHALLSSGFLFSCCCCCWETAAAAK